MKSNTSLEGVKKLAAFLLLHLNNFIKVYDQTRPNMGAS